MAELTKAMGPNKKRGREVCSKTTNTTKKLLPNTTLQLQNFQKAKAAEMLAEKATRKRDLILFKGSQADWFNTHSDKLHYFTKQ